MVTLAGILRLCAVVTLLPAAACQSMFPGNDDPTLALLQPEPSLPPPGATAPVETPQAALRSPAAASPASSAQRLGPDGYPLLGAYPAAAAPQLPNSTVAAERQQLQAAARSQAAVDGTSQYDAQLAELERIAAEQRREAEAVLEPNSPAALQQLAKTRADETIRAIEGR